MKVKNQENYFLSREFLGFFHWLNFQIQTKSSGERVYRESRSLQGTY